MFCRRTSRDQLSVQPEQSIRGYEGLYFEESFSADLLGLHRESSALLMGKPKLLSVQLLPQSSVLLLEEFDRVLLMAIYPASEDQHQKLQRQSVHQLELRPA